MFFQVAPLSVKFYVNKVVVESADGDAYGTNVLINKPIDKTPPKTKPNLGIVYTKQATF